MGPKEFLRIRSKRWHEAKMAGKKNLPMKISTTKTTTMSFASDMRIYTRFPKVLCDVTPVD